MKRTILVFVSFAVALIFAAPASAAVNDFVIERYEIDYKLSRDDNGRSKLKTIEKIEAVFSNRDQNRGIERALPTSYDGHTTNLTVNSVKSDKGRRLPYSTYSSAGNLVVRIGDANKYVHGKQVYILEYTQRDVTKFFKDSSSDEFYWDTNGTDWKVPINRLKVNLQIDDALSANLNEQVSCYQGKAGSTDKCTLARTSSGFTVTGSNLAPGENITIAIGFAASTFNPYKQTLLDKIMGWWMISLFITFLATVVLILWFTLRFNRITNRKNAQTTVVPQYLPPKNASVTVSASIYNKPSTAFSAQLIDLAVRHYLKIYQTGEKTIFRRAKFELEITKDISKLANEEQELITDIFADTKVGARLKMEDMKKNSYSVTRKLSDNKKKLDTDIRGKYGLREKGEPQRRWFKHAGLIVLGLSVITLSPWLFMAAIAAFIFAYTLWPLTDKGVNLFSYLEGLKMYIKVAEKDRLKVLQSPSGAAKTKAPINIDDKRQMVKLYERVLPYAILFGQEKQWNKELGKYYESLQTSPDWYVSNNGVFNAAVLGSAISNFNSAATYSNPTSSSSSGAGGGGFSGGGGGGGGGGGW